MKPDSSINVWHKDGIGQDEENEIRVYRGGELADTKGIWEMITITCEAPVSLVVEPHKTFTYKPDFSKLPPYRFSLRPELLVEPREACQILNNAMKKFAEEISGCSTATTGERPKWSNWLDF